MDDQALRPRKHRRPTKPLPDDIVSEILSRLPAEVVLKYRLVCKTWCDLTSNQHFVELHKKNNTTTPMILVHQRLCDHRGNCLVDTKRKRPRIHRIQINSSSRILFSCDGLIILKRYFQSSEDFFVFNPMISAQGQKEVRIKILLLRQVEVCGIFFHPIVKEYCILWRCCRSGQAGPACFKMLNLGSQPYWRELRTDASICNNYQAADPGRLSCAAVIADDILYWLAQHKNWYGIGILELYFATVEIIAFDIKKETFCLIPQPCTKDKCIKHSGCCSKNLLKLDGHLSLVQSCIVNWSLTISIWILKDYENKFWMKTRTINTNLDYMNRMLQPIAIVNEELILLWPGHRLFACNLQSGTVRNFVRKHASMVLNTWAHVTSLVSMMNCKSEIEMPQYDE